MITYMITYMIKNKTIGNNQQLLTFLFEKKCLQEVDSLQFFQIPFPYLSFDNFR